MIPNQDWGMAINRYSEGIFSGQVWRIMGVTTVLAGIRLCCAGFGKLEIRQPRYDTPSPRSYGWAAFGKRTKDLFILYLLVFSFSYFENLNKRWNNTVAFRQGFKECVITSVF